MIKSIKKAIAIEHTVSKSTFLTKLYPVNTEATVKMYLDKLKEAFPDASHHCFGYILGNNQEVQRFDDDGEPSQTAGMPILSVLKQNDVTNILCVVIRYFGGIKLGAGGLVRAYRKSANLALKEAHFSYPKTYALIQIGFAFEIAGKLEALIHTLGDVVSTTYDDCAHLTVRIEHENYALFQAKIEEASQQQVTLKILSLETVYQ